MGATTHAGPSSSAAYSIFLPPASTRFFLVRVASAPLPTALNRARRHISDQYAYECCDRDVARALRPTCASLSPAPRRSSSPSRHQHYTFTSQQGRTAASSKRSLKILSWSVTTRR